MTAPSLTSAASLTLDCAGTAVALVGDDRWLELVRREYGGFAADRPASVTVRLGATEATPAHADATVAGRPRLAGLHPVLRQLYPAIVDGLVFHASVLVFGEAGYLCCGSSGAGKSTLARLCPAAMRGDELGAVRRTPSGLVVASLPYHRGRRCQARLAGVMLLRHGERDVRQRVGPAEALALLTRHVFWPKDTGAVAAGFELLADLVDTVPVSWLAFQPTPAVARLFAPGPAEVA
jgi:hypothetical protein